jgi:transcriptional regulator with XRE-family HTH domain
VRDDLQAALARRLKAARTLSGKSVAELARELGWSGDKVYRFERGARLPDALEVAAIAVATSQSVEFLLLGGPPREPEAGTVSPHEPAVNRVP